jgi:hypothetical protein
MTGFCYLIIILIIVIITIIIIIALLFIKMFDNSLKLLTGRY